MRVPRRDRQTGTHFGQHLHFSQHGPGNGCFRDLHHKLHRRSHALEPSVHRLVHITEVAFVYLVLQQVREVWSVLVLLQLPVHRRRRPIAAERQRNRWAVSGTCAGTLALCVVSHSTPACKTHLLPHREPVYPALRVESAWAHPTACALTFGAALTHTASAPPVPAPPAPAHTVGGVATRERGDGPTGAHGSHAPIAPPDGAPHARAAATHVWRHVMTSHAVGNFVQRRGGPLQSISSHRCGAPALGCSCCAAAFQRLQRGVRRGNGAREAEIAVAPAPGPAQPWE